ncbi:phage portal protein [Nonomuraea sp. NPDC050451]|uniref:phage portal protein n=1 Tax=Nonomuraea sp. NPDC050451 TaxID=3364364 RepID=UPI0037AE6654
MGILDKIRAYKERSFAPGVAGLPNFGFGDYFGHEGVHSPEEYGDFLATSNEIFSAAMLRARLLSSLNLKLYRGRGQSKQIAENSPAGKLLNYVNPFWTPKRLARMDELSMCLWGETYWAIERKNGKPSEIWWMKAPRVRPVLDAENYIKHYLYEPVAGSQPIRFEPNEIVWFRYPNPLDEFTAISPVVAARLAAESASAMMKSNKNMFVNGLRLGGIITPTDKVTFTEEQATDVEMALERRATGVDKAHKWLILRYEAQLQGLNVSPKDAEFLGGLQMTLKQIANAYGIPVALLNDMDSATLTNSREYQSILWTNALKPDAELKAEEIEEQFLPLFPGTVDHCAYDFTEVEPLQEAKSESWMRERQAIDVGRYTINEIRARNGEPPVPWGDVWWAPVNKFAVSNAESEPPSTSQPADDTDPETKKGETDDPTPPEVSEDDTRTLFKALELNGRMPR